MWYIVVWGVNLFVCDLCSQSNRKVRKKKFAKSKDERYWKKRKQTLPKKKVNISPLWNRNIFKTDSALQSHLANGGKKNITVQGMESSDCTHPCSLYIYMIGIVTYIHLQVITPISRIICLSAWSHCMISVCLMPSHPISPLSLLS